MTLLPLYHSFKTFLRTFHAEKKNVLSIRKISYIFRIFLYHLPFNATLASFLFLIHFILFFKVKQSVF